MQSYGDLVWVIGETMPTIGQLEGAVTSPHAAWPGRLVPAPHDSIVDVLLEDEWVEEVSVSFLGERTPPSSFLKTQIRLFDPTLPTRDLNSMAAPHHRAAWDQKCVRTHSILCT